MLGREGLLRKMRFPRLVVPLAVTLTALFQLTTNMIPIFVLALIRGIRPTWAWLELIPVITLLAVLAAGLGMLMSVLYVRARDVQPIWDVTAQLCSTPRRSSTPSSTTTTTRSTTTARTASSTARATPI